MRDWVHAPRPGEPAPGRDAIGGKAAALAALAAVRGPGGAAPEVPRWVVLRTEAFAALAPTGIGDGSDRRAAILAVQPPQELRTALRVALEAAGLWGRTAAVRSSAAAEDGASASFAGQYESVLGVPLGPGDDALWDAIRRVWASAVSAHATAYGAA
ncbi:MAG: PEP/pyruvate-binding domain-containing protein, partial [Candidatus Eisenbacteria bacterium]